MQNTPNKFLTKITVLRRNKFNRMERINDNDFSRELLRLYIVIVEIKKPRTSKDIQGSI